MTGEGHSPASPSSPMRRPITIVSARFEDLVSIGLQQLINEDSNLQLLHSDCELEDLEDVVEREQPAVVLLNFGSLPNAAWIYQLHQSRPESRIVVLANRPTAAEANQILSFGATACISKETQGRDIINAIHLASRGMRVLPRQTSAPAEPLERFDYLAEADILTAREAEVLQLLQEGMSNAEIAQALSIGIETVRTHARNIYRKLGISTRRDLARFSRERPPAHVG
jgi:DNA-binding NarL/FixJ family response regulator